MAKITNDLKRIQRISSVITRAIENCFSNAEISCLLCKFEYEEFTFELTSTIFDYTEINIDVSDKSSEKCMSRSIKQLLDQINKIINNLESDEKELRRDLKKYGQAFSESPAVLLSSIQMFKQIIESIR
ncbi:hypothetical protein [Pseudoalteromonas sp. T1lg24]|uniref:hypothetical protein n=1 Tax=Pseudoalteromonas sp. T1lg24 TaxID=2077099 RepID=UPI000CF5DF6A|nr:hypothetical protein [Pseudoalteromonas sp. T1lg24]